MKLIVLSDTHLKTGEIPGQLQSLLEDCDLIVHAEDLQHCKSIPGF